MTFISSKNFMVVGFLLMLAPLAAYKPIFMSSISNGTQINYRFDKMVLKDGVWTGVYSQNFPAGTIELSNDSFVITPTVTTFSQNDKKEWASGIMIDDAASFLQPVSFKNKDGKDISLDDAYALWYDEVLKSKTDEAIAEKLKTLQNEAHEEIERLNNKEIANRERALHQSVEPQIEELNRQLVEKNNELDEAEGEVHTFKSNGLPPEAPTVKKIISLKKDIKETNDELRVKKSLLEKYEAEIANFKQKIDDLTKKDKNNFAEEIQAFTQQIRAKTEDDVFKAEHSRDVWNGKVGAIGIEIHQEAAKFGGHVNEHVTFLTNGNRSFVGKSFSGRAEPSWLIYTSFDLTLSITTTFSGKKPRSTALTIGCPKCTDNKVEDNVASYKFSW